MAHIVVKYDLSSQYFDLNSRMILCFRICNPRSFLAHFLNLNWAQDSSVIFQMIFSTLLIYSWTFSLSLLPLRFPSFLKHCKFEISWFRLLWDQIYEICLFCFLSCYMKYIFEFWKLTAFGWSLKILDGNEYDFSLTWSFGVGKLTLHHSNFN